MDNEEKIIELLTDIKGLLIGFIGKDSGNTDKKPFKRNKPVQKATRFNEFWSVYPTKSDKKKAALTWASRNMDKIADTLIADVVNRTKSDPKWIAGYIPLPTTYLNGDRWEDDIQAAVKPATAVNLSDYIIPADWKERGFKVGVKQTEREKYTDFRSRVLENEMLNR